MKYLLNIGLLSVSILGINAQPTIQWQRCFGGSDADVAFSINQTNDSSFILAGEALSVNGNVTNNKGVTDFWAVKVDKNGNLLWQKAYGGTDHDRCYGSDVTTDGGIIMVGPTWSNNINVSGHHGDIDGWVIKLDQNGILQWQKCLGGSSWDELWSVQQTADGGYIAVGRAGSNDGDVTGWQGALDFWVVKLSPTGDIQWQKALGGSLVDIGYAIKQTPDGGYIVAGESSSMDGDCIGLHGGADIWVVKLSEAGEFEWQKMLGGTSYETAYDIITTLDGGYAVMGQITYNDGDVSGFYGKFDYWVAKLDANGTLEWEHTYGGSEADYSQAIIQTEDGQYILVGATQSSDGDAIGNDGGRDFWVVRIDSIGDIVWQIAFGGTQDETAFSAVQAYDGGLAIAGWARSNNGDVSGNHGSTDYWIVKLAPETSTTQTPTAIPLNLYPNPATTWITLNLPIIEQNMQVNITDEQGKLLLSRTIRTDEKLDIALLPKGVYWVSAVSKSGQVYAGKFVKG
ncbi:MAG: T9SS type A sorting domain-containing protein [Saprospiraceae bacterium]|nr:T9SS type A sorting domain-containing protein [Saprospiraceae bacterium]